jgi:hypothetical protein
MDKLKLPLYVNAIYFLILGVSALSASTVLTVFDYEVKDSGILLVTAGAFLGFGTVLLAIASDPAKHGTLVGPIMTSLMIFVVFLLWGWVRHMFTARNIVAPAAIDLALIAWMWSSKQRR